LSRVRWELDRMVEARLEQPFEAHDVARYLALTEREAALLRSPRTATASAGETRHPLGRERPERELGRGDE
jgi:hypothetical protein